MNTLRRDTIGSMAATVCLRVAIAATLVGFPDVGADENASHFRQKVAPILVRSCLECHSGNQPSGGLDLSSADSLVTGGESGRVIDQANPGESLLWQMVSSGQMPPEGKLSETDLSELRAWMDAGARWEGESLDPFEMTTSRRAGYDWWSLQPIVDPPVPTTKSITSNPIDAFVTAKLESKGLSMAPRASAATLVRRLSMRLHGIHPSIEDVRRLQQDDTAEAFEQLTAEYLQSHRYGERWARHWLDLARFGESQGFERDKSRPHAWRYRDWVINALNDDMPYDQFARMQIAGDCDPASGRNGVIATGFLVAGGYDEVGQNQQSAAMKAVVRQDELEDYVGTVGQTFLGLTTNCARCHDHKFDPIRQSEYYALCSALDGVRHGRRDITDPAVIRTAKKNAADTKAAIESAVAKLAQLERPAIQSLVDASQDGDKAMTLVGRPLAHWDFEDSLGDRFGNLIGVAKGGARLEDGDLVLDGETAHVMTAPLGREILAKTLSVRLTLDNLDQRGGGAISLLDTKKAFFDSIVFGERQPRRWMAGSDHFRRTRNLNGPEEGDAANQSVHLAISYAVDGTIKAYRNGEPYGTAYRTEKQHRFGPQDVVTFGIRLLPVGGNRMLAGRIHEASLFDRVLSDNEVRDLAEGADFVTDSMLMAQLSPDQRRERTKLKDEIARLRKVDTSVQRQYTYAVNPRQPEQPTRLLVRGSTANPTDVVAPAGLSSVQGLPSEFGLAPDAPEAERRKRLADWITSRDNPLFARVIVNRLWQHHFGAGLVSTPNDFGFSGGDPSHPELLDYLAARLIESGWSLKSLHALIVSSRTWQQASISNEKAIQLDAGNRLLWRGNRIRMDAETLRDSILLVAGQLNDAQGGPPFQDFTTFNFNSQFYEMTDPIGPEYNRRTIYRMVIRSGRNRMLDAFDCPDPSATAPKRAVTTTPLQALSLLNHSFALRMADRFSERMTEEVGDDPPDQVERASQIVWCREPTEQESEAMVDFVNQHGLAALCRVLINSNEFLYVD